jgi:hypothetical protein
MLPDHLFCLSATVSTPTLPEKKVFLNFVQAKPGLRSSVCVSKCGVRLL